MAIEIEANPMQTLFSTETRIEKWWAIHTAYHRALRDTGQLPPEDLAYLDALHPEDHQLPLREDFHTSCRDLVCRNMLSRRDDLTTVVWDVGSSEGILELINLMLVWESARLLTPEVAECARRFNGDIRHALSLQEFALRELTRDPLAAASPVVKSPELAVSMLQYLSFTLTTIPIRELQGTRRKVVNLVLLNLASTARRAAPHKAAFIGCVADLEKACAPPHHPLPMVRADWEFPERDYQFYRTALPLAYKLLRDPGWKEVS